MNSVEKLAYLKGLIEGLGLDETKKDTRVIFNLVELLEDIVFNQTKFSEKLKDLQEQVDAVDEDLGEIEKELYDDGCGCAPPAMPQAVQQGNGGSKSGNNKPPVASELYYEVTCPTCGETITLDEETINEGEVDCPKCGEKLEFDLEG